MSYFQTFLKKSNEVKGKSAVQAPKYTIPVINK